MDMLLLFLNGMKIKWHFCLEVYYGPSYIYALNEVNFVINQTYINIYNYIWYSYIDT